MKQLIHPSACISSSARLGDGVSVGPFAIIEDDVVIGENSSLSGHVFIGRGTRMGARNRIFTGAAIGHESQSKSASSHSSFVEIGNGNTFREFVTIHAGTSLQTKTSIGDNNLLMTSCHVAHDCVLGNQIVMSSAVLLAGHVSVEDHAVLGGGSGVHQFCRIGAYAMLGGHALALKDVPPFMLVGANDCHIGSVNLVGLRRAGFSERDKSEIKKCYCLLYLEGLSLEEAVQEIKRLPGSASRRILRFVEESERGLMKHRGLKETRLAS